MPSHARPARPFLSRPRTVLSLGLLASSLTALAVVQGPASAMADPLIPAPDTGSTPVDDTSTVLSIVELDRSHMAHIVEQRMERVAKRERLEARERREQRAERAARQERRAEARAAARAAARAPQWVLPVAGAGWSASFGEAGSAWSSGYHTGQDFTAPSGTPVHAVSDGTITSATWSDAYGNIIEITHPNGDQSWYAHMTGFERTSGGVDAGDVIGYVGCTGNCYGSHVHFEYHPGGGDAADPLPWLRDNGAY